MTGRRRPFLLAALALCALTGCRAERRSVILVTVDALRADHLGLYGAPAGASPRIDALGAQGAIVEAAWAPMPRTTQAVGTLLTGLHPLAHGADGLGMALPPRPATLAEAFRKQGYVTAAFTTNMFLKPGLGFERGFDLYSNPQPRWHGDSASALTAEALAWVKENAATGKPFFLWIHYLDPHWTYDPPEPFRHASDANWHGDSGALRALTQDWTHKGDVIFSANRDLGGPEIDHLRRLYGGEVAYTDQQLGQLADGLAQQGVLDRAILAVTADHGESLGEHAYWFAHGEYLYDDSLHVPLAVRAPGLVPAGTRIAGNVPTLDVAPTLLDLAGLPPLAGADGKSLAPLLRAGGRPSAPAVQLVHLSDHELVHGENPRRPVPGRAGRWWAIRDGAWKLIRYPAGNDTFVEELYDTAADPGEVHDLARERADVTARLRAALLERQRELLARWQASGAQEPAPEDQQMLKSLGYAR